MCERCGRPVVVCYCAHLSQLPTRTKVLVLQHPRERDNAIGTARMAALCLPNSEIAVGVRFADDPGVCAALADPARPAVLLYPSREPGVALHRPPEGPVTLVVLDGTWAQARSLLNKNPMLQALPRYAFVPPRPSEYRIRREPQDDFVSTIEALCHTLGALERDPQRFEALLAPFRAMVETQLDYARRVASSRHRRRDRPARSQRSRLPARLLEPDLVCITVEANAWPHDRALGRAPHPHELVHVCALRLSDGACFEAIAAPRLPLGPSAMQHSRIPLARLQSGVSLAELRAAWAAFLRPTDVPCAWGLYGASLLQRDDIALPSAPIDLRRIAGNYIKARPGSVEDLVARLALPWHATGLGRGGERLGMTAAVTRMMLDGAGAGSSGGLAAARSSC